MKAIDIIKHMVADSTVAEHGGTMPFYEGDDPTEWAKDKFGAEILCGEVGPEETEYFWMYGIDIVQSGICSFVRSNVPDVHLIDSNGGGIYLWRIEE